MMFESQPYMRETTRREFVAAFGREPRMASKIDCEERDRLSNQGWELIEVTRIGDDIKSFLVTQMYRT